LNLITGGLSKAYPKNFINESLPKLFHLSLAMD
jgi:hypothetical protein